MLSEGAVSERAITKDEAHPIISRLALLIYKAQDSHYDISTTIVTLKNHALALEERAKAAIVQSAEFGQLAAESFPKNLHCLTVKHVFFYSASGMIFSATPDITLRNYDVLSHCDSILG